MKKSFFNHAVVLFHVLYWSRSVVPIIVLWSYRANRNSNIATILELDLISTIANMFLFYIIYFWLFPSFLHKRKFIPFIILLLLNYGVAFLIAYIIRPSFNHLFTNQPEAAFIGQIASSLVFTATIACLLQGFISWHKESKYRKQLEMKNLETSMALLKAQTSPHFLFNTLNNIDVLIEKEPVTASAYLKKLSDILRFTLYETPQEQVLLADELNYINQYIDLQRIRTSNTNFVRFATHGNPAGITIAPMLFIPLVENAFKHCTNKKANNGIEINIDIQPQAITFNCSNAYEANATQLQQKSGLGLQLIQTRLELLYPNNYQFNINQTADRFNVTLSINLNHDY